MGLAARRWDPQTASTRPARHHRGRLRTVPRTPQPSTERAPEPPVLSVAITRALDLQARNGVRLKAVPEPVVDEVLPRSRDS